MGFLFSFQPLSDNIVAENMKKGRVGSPARPFKIYCKYELFAFLAFPTAVPSSTATVSATALT